MKLWKFFLIALMTGLLVVFACSEEETPTDQGGGGPDPNVFCNEAGCILSETLKNQCIEAFNTCIANEPANEEECIALAILICQ
jgi:hypothetical protein